MSNKHYDITYLENTVRLLKNLKDHSYKFFLPVEEGRIVDLGCGSGNDVIALSEFLGQNVKVTGIDHDPEMLKQAEMNSQSMENVNFVLSEAFPLPFEDQSISGLRSERLIQHLKNPEAVFGEINRVLKESAPLAIIETDWFSLSFYTEFTDVQNKINSFLTDVKVNNGFAARKLTSYLSAAGFRDIKFEIHPFVVNSLQEANEYFWIEKITNEACEKGFISAEESQRFFEGLQTADDNNYFSCSINLVVATCIK